MNTAIGTPDDELLAVSQAYVALPADKRTAFRGQVHAAGIDPAHLPIVPFPLRESRFPLSYAQERLWFLWRLDPSGSAYNLSGAVRLEGTMQPARVRQALDIVLRRHESLRKRFEEIDGVPWQVVCEPRLGWAEHDLAQGDQAQREERLRTLLVTLATVPFDLQAEPLLRVALIRLDAATHVLHFCVHHIVSDAWSMDVLHREFAAAYALAGESSPLALPAMPIQYGDFALWQREWLDKPALDRQLEYWRERLGSEHPVLELPLTRRRSGLRSAAGARVARTIPAARMSALKEIARRHDTTLFVVLLAAYMVLLARYSGQQDIRVGVPVAGRDRTETEPVIGFFVNTLVMRGELQGLVRVSELIEQVRVRLLEARLHQDLPFAQLVDALQPARSLSHTPLFQTMFNFGVASRSEIRVADLAVSGVPTDLDSSRFDLVLNVFEGKELDAGLNYSTDVFDQATVSRMLVHYAEILEQFALGGGNLPLGEIALGVEGPPRAPRAHYPFIAATRRIDEHAAKRPRAPALHCEGERLDYGRLSAWSNQVAHRLRRLGVRADERVGLCVERSTALVAGLLGIMKSGAAFVPLDPSYPPDRIAYMMRDAGVQRVLADAGTAFRLADLLQEREVVVVDRVEDEAQSPLDIAVHPDQLAYVIYTSGSTGLPKGVAISQRALGLHLDDFIATYGIGAADKQFQSSTINFDVALHEMLPALMQGGQVEMRGPNLWDLETTSQQLASQQVTFARIPTAYWQQWLRNPPPAHALAALRQITVGGEGLPGDALRRWQDGPLARIRLDNLYGPTETAVACMYRQTERLDAEQAIVSIGIPYPSRHVYVMDGEGNEVPAGGLGELCIGGETLARAYLGRPGLTAEKFVPDPAREDGGRLYRSGDLCKRRADGTVDFLGRIDQQVKLRGFRIELGEIESVLRQADGVSEAVVELQGEGEGRRLVAYTVGAAQAAALRAAAAARLPAYMVPAEYVSLDRLPLLPSGKVDRRALPVPQAGANRDAVAPRDAAEASLLAVWRDVLRRDDLGVTDNFFESGGDSILSLQIVARARREGYTLTPRQIFEHPTVAELVRLAPVAVDAAAFVEVTQALGLTPIQKRFFDRFPQGESHWNQSVLLAVRGHLDVDALKRAVASLYGRHDALRLRFVRDEDGGWTQRVSPLASADILDVFDLKGEPDWAVALERAADRLQTRLDIGQGPLLRIGYFELDGQARLLLCVHHLAVDGVSWRVLLEDLQLAYEQALRGEPVVLAASVPWSMWVQRQLAYAQSDGVAAQASWWRAALNDAVATLPVNEHISADSARSITVGLDEATTLALLHDAPLAYRSGAEDILLAALVQTLGPWTGSSGVLVALEGHGREALDEELDLSRTVGWFTTQYPVWLPAGADAGRAIVAVKERLRSVPHKGLHFGLLGDRLADLPQPRIGFNYLGQFDQSLAQDGRFTFAAESAGAETADSPADMVLDLNSMIAAGRLSMSWTYRQGELDEGTVRDLADRYIVALRALVDHCVGARPGATVSDFPLAAISQPQLERLELDFAEIEDIYPATPVQQGLLFHGLMQAGEGVYVNQKRATFKGAVDVQGMRRAWQAAVDRHAVLRTHFEWRHGGDALQVVHRTATLPFSLMDWSDLEPQDYETRLAAWRAQDVARGFDLGRAPLLRVAVFHRPDGGDDLLWTDHHALMDGWSSASLMSDVLRHYSGETPPAQGGRYRDYVAWLHGRDARGDEAYWREQLGRMQGPTMLAGTRAIEPGEATGVGELNMELDVAATARVVAYAREQQVTVNTLVQGAWTLTLATLTAQACVVFGATVAGRPAELPAAESILGLFINTLPMVVPVAGGMRLDDWLRTIQASGLSLQEHAHVAPADVQRLAGDASQALFDSIVVFENYPIDQVLQGGGSSGLQFAGLQHHEETNYALTLIVTLSDRLSLQLRYRRDGGADGLAQRALGYAGRIVAALPDHGTRAVGDVQWLDLDEAQDLLACSRGDNLQVAADTVHAAIAAQARATPTAVALLYRDESLTYAELNARANRLAHCLAAYGVGPETKVGVALPRSVDLVVCLLAVLKAGAAYVPLDPSLPADRLHYMINDSGLTVVLARQAASLSWPAGLRTLDPGTLDLAAQPASDPVMEVHPENLAYVIYTSGSTGRPKGAANRHGALANRLAWMQQAYGLEAGDTVLQKTPFSFDVSVWEFFWPLMTGARLAVAEPGAHRDPAELVEAIQRYGVTTVHFVPSMLQAFAAYDGAGRCFSIRNIVCSGEALPASLQDSVMKLLPAARLVNLYGPTEAAIDVTHWTCRAGDAVVPIGRPIANVHTYVLDAAMNLAPVGLVGELYLGGAGLGRGYVGKPGLTAERFVPDPYDGAGGRLYRTGDLARWGTDGRLQYLGRVDDQVKVRGFRIELGEIEAQLHACAEVAEAVVTARPGASGPQLAAYVTAAAGQALDGQALRGRLAAALPEYMVPATITVLDSLPLNANGKLDRRALPEPQYAVQEYEAPQGQVESILAGIWHTVLGIARVGRNDNFFELGGDSILSLRIVAHARTAGVLLTPRQIFEHPTLAGLAPAVRAGGMQADHAEVVEALDLTPIQQAFFTRFPQGQSHWNQSVMLSVEGGLEIPALSRALETLVAAHDALRLRFERNGQGVWQQRVAPVEAAAILEPRDLRGAPDSPAALQGAATALQASLDLEQGPILRAAYFAVEGGARLLLVIHHLAVDGVSWRILLEELQQLYDAALADQPAPVLTNTPWSAWVRHQLGYARSQLVQDEAPWWRQALSGVDNALPLNEDSAPGESRGIGASLDEAETRQLLQASARSYRANAEDILLTALAQTVGAWSGRAGVLLALEGHGRENLGEDDTLDLSRTVGWFTTRYPVWLPAESEAGRAIVAVKEQLRAVPRRGLHFGLLGQHVAALPQPRIAFNYLGQFDNSLTRAGRFAFAPEAGGEAVPRGLAAEMPIEVNAMVSNGCLSVRWSYRAGELADAVARELQQAFMARLRTLIAHCASATPTATASDFPLARLSQAELDQLKLPLGKVEDIYPATPVQQGMVFHSLLSTGAGVYLNQKRLTLRGELSPAFLRQAWMTVVARHAVLRTHFAWTQDGRALQVVLRAAEPPYREEDWSMMSAARYEDALREWQQDDIGRGFDVGHAPLLRVALFTRPDHGHDLVWTDHHALMDGWSSAQLMGEVMHAYAARVTGATAVLKPAQPYRDYVAWLQARPDAAPWWRAVGQRYADPAVLLESLGRGAADLDPVARMPGLIRADLGRELTGQLRLATQRYKVTLNTLMQASWAIVLARYGNRRNVAFGVTVSGRPAELPNVETMMGLFINTVPLWFGVPADETLERWLPALQDHNSQLRQYEYASLADIQQWLGRSADALFDTLMVFESYPVDETLRRGEHALEVAALETVEKTHYALAIAVVPGAAIDIKWKWDRARIGDVTANRLLEDFKQVLADLAWGNVRCVGDIVLPTRHTHAALATHGFQPVAARIAARAGERGAQCAVACDGQTLSYAELEAWSNRIGRRLRRLGAGREDRVGIYMERSCSLPAALLGILKAGAAFVPLDPAYPQARIAEMMDDARLGWLVADRSVAALPPELLAGRAIVWMDDVAGESGQGWDESIHVDQLAYVIYTSGSTGKPKGVSISHGALGRHLDDFLATYRITADDRQLQSSTINFDVALHEMLPALMMGGRVVMRGPRPWDLETMNRRLLDEQVTFARIPTAYWQQWMRDPPSAADLCLRQITVGGEALPGDALAQWRAGPLAHIRLDNLYGPTETAVACTYQETGPADVQHVAVPIGKPYPSRTACILDLDGNEVPVGGLGELCIGGTTLARGYHDRPGLTAQRFIPDPHGAAGSRLYRTGDLCRRQVDGSIEFLGRIDQQVKLRGFRIELGEIEMALRGMPGVREAAAELRGDGEDRKLVGYVVGSVSLPALRVALAARLPQHMVPAILLELPALPLLPNGKIDRRALPDGADVARDRQTAGPGTRMQALLLSIWREVLQREDIGITDDFFDMGGNSLKALTVASLAGRHRIAAFSLESLFAHPTVAALAAHLDAQSPDTPSNIFPLNAATGRYDLFLIHPGYGLVAEYRALARQVEGVANVHGVQSPLYSEPDWWPPTLVDTARDYVERIRRIQPTGPYHLLGWSSGGWIAREMAFVLEAMGEEVAFLGMVDSPPRDAAALAAIAPATPGQAREVGADEIDALARAVQGDADRWQGILPAGTAGNEVLRTSLMVGRHFADVERSGHQGGQAAALTLWRAEDGAAIDGAEYLARWRDVSRGPVRLAGSIGTDHVRIIHHPSFLESAGRVLTSLRSGLHD